MKTSVRFAAILLALALSVSVFSSCEKAAENNADNGENQGEKQEEENVHGDDQEEEEEMELVINDTFYPKYGYLAKEYKSMKAKISEWFYKNLEEDTLFSVCVGKDGISAIKARWQKEVKKDTDENGNETVEATYKDGAIKYTLTATLYADAPTVDYVIWAENTGSEMSEKISAFCPLDANFELPASKGYALHTSRGSLAKVNDFEPIEQTITKGNVTYTYGPSMNYENGEIYPRGRSTDGAWPYFDVIGKDCGILLAIGWTGQWEAVFGNSKAGELSMKAYQRNLDTVLLPGEKLRTPSIVLTYFDGDADYGHNVFRKLIVNHYTYKNDEENYFVSPIAINFWGGVTEDFLVDLTKAYSEKAFVPDLVWMDAGWYADYPRPEYGVWTASHNAGEQAWNTKVGWWTVNPKLFPAGTLNKVSETVHACGSKLLLWLPIEYGRAKYIDKMSFAREDYYSLALGSGYSAAAGDNLMLNLADDAVCDKAIDLIRSFIDEQGVDCIRSDNMSAHWYHWLQNDRELSAKIDPSREDLRDGYTENRHILNYYRLWDTLYAEYPQFELDHCAGGGRRIDIEMTKRGVPLWRTDYDHTDLEAMQAQTQWISYWLPFSAIGVVEATNTYGYRSRYSSSQSFRTSKNVFETLDMMKAEYDELAHVRPYWYGSFYTLLTPDTTKETWGAYELFREDWQKGMAVVIRKELSAITTVKIKFKGLIADRNYLVHNLDDEDGSEDIVKSGSDLMKSGLNVTASPRTINVYEISIVTEE